MEGPEFTEENLGDVKPKYSIQIRITHPSEDVSRFTKLLNRDPQWCWRVGAPRRSLNGDILKGTYNNCYWSHTSWHSERDFFRNMMEVASSFEGIDDLKGSFLDTGGEIMLVVGLESGKNIGSVLTPTNMERLFTLGLSVGVELFVSRESP